MRRTLVLVTALTTLATSALAALQPGAGLASEPGGDRYGLVRNILPPGSRGNATALDLLQVGPSRTASPTTPANFADQLEMYDALTKQAPGSITAADLDRLFLMDALRHAGQARLAEFAGGTAGNLAMDQAQLRSAYYTPAEAAAQIA